MLQVSDFAELFRAVQASRLFQALQLSALLSVAGPPTARSQPLVRWVLPFGCCLTYVTLACQYYDLIDSNESNGIILQLTTKATLSSSTIVSFHFGHDTRRRLSLHKENRN